MMKVPRTEKLVVVIGRNKRVYARVYKMEKFIEPFVRHCEEKENWKSIKEGFSVTGHSTKTPDDSTIICHMEYEPLPEDVFRKILSAKESGGRGIFLGFC